METVIEASEVLRKMNKGRYREKVLEFCLSKHGLSQESTNAALNEAIKQKKMYTSVVHGKQSYRKYDDKICIEDDKESCYTQTDPTTQNDCISKQDFERFLTDFEDFKKYIHCEMLSIKADVASRQKPQNPPISPDGDREALVRTLNERIMSLERQLHEKQYVIQKLFEGPKQNQKTNFHEIPREHNNDTSQTSPNEEQKRKPTTIKDTNKGDASTNSKQHQNQTNNTRTKQENIQKRQYTKKYCNRWGFHTKWYPRRRLAEGPQRQSKAPFRSDDDRYCGLSETSDQEKTRLYNNTCGDK